MEEVRSSKRIRAARGAAPAEDCSRESRAGAAVEEASNVDRPVYHPRLGIVMTYEQQDALKRQITVFATICQQLVELHKASVAAAADDDARVGQDLNGNSSGQREPTPTTVLKATPRHRWAPSQSQIQMLERIYESGTGATPNKKKVKEITEQLSAHGSVTETNVYNWFQNRKARVRRRNQRLSSVREADSEGDTEDRKPGSKALDSGVEGEEQSRLIYLDGDLCEVPAGVFSLRERFGDRVLLVNEREEIVPTDEGGFLFQPLQSGGSYRLSE